MKRSWSISIASLAGLCLLYAGERIAEGGTARGALSLSGVVLVVAALAWRGVRMARADSERRVVERTLGALQVIALAALALYALSSDVTAKVSTKAWLSDSPVLSGGLGALFPALLFTAALATLLVELAYAAQAKAPRLELLRVREALYSGVGFSSALVLTFALQYVASERDVKADLSYFRTAKPGEATRALVASLDAPVNVAVFFPPASDVAVYLKAYFDALQEGSSQLKVEFLDHALEPVRAKALGVTRNGTVVFSKGGRNESFIIELELERARSALRGLDAEMQKRLLAVATSRKTVYLTTGHGERAEEASAVGDGRATVSLLRERLRQQNYELKPLSAAEGLASAVPSDAAAVVIVGPTSTFSEPEARALEAYGKKGGRLLIALDPEAGFDFSELLAPLGVSFSPVVLAHETAHAVRANNLSDRTLIGARSFSSHPSVTSSSRQGFPLFFMGAGAVEERSPRAAELSYDAALRAEAGTFGDLNRNFTFDGDTETRKGSTLIAAVTRRGASGKPEDELRALVLGDSDALGDEVLAVAPGNIIFSLDAVKWLAGEEKLAGATQSETDVVISRTRQQDAVWFYGTIFLAPALVVGTGAWVTRRRRKAPGVRS